MQHRKRGASETTVSRLLQQALQSGEASASQQGQRAGDDEEEDDDALLQALPTDLMAAIRFLRTQTMGYHTARTSLPLVLLRSQLRSIVKDTTDIERELDKLRRENVIRVFKLSTGPDEYAILLTEDYVQRLREAAAEQLQQQQGQQQQQVRQASDHQQQQASKQQRVVDAFCARVLPHHTDLLISHARLAQLLARAPQGDSPSSSGGSPGHLARPPDPQASGHSQQGQRAPRARPLAVPLPPADVQVSLLMQAGALSRDPGDESMYVLSVPGLGTVVQAIVAGRRELRAVLARRKYLEMPEQQLLTKTKLRKSPLGVAFHLRDLLGLGLVHRVGTTSGAIIRLVKK